MIPERQPKRIDFERWLNTHPPLNDPRYNAIRSREKKWGAYLRAHWPDNFELMYQAYWLDHKELWDLPYQDNIPEEQIPFV